MGSMLMYEGIKIILATKHKKEEAIRKPFVDHFHAEVNVPVDYDTDKYGTFTGEIQRIGNSFETVLKKAKDAMGYYDYQYAIANEGSFAPHPLYFFLPSDIELMIFIDGKNNFTIVESEVSTETNFSHMDISSHDDYTNFLSKVKFGSHGLVVKSVDDNTVIAKGITQQQELVKIIKSSFLTYKKIRLETDMRAMMNPTRMKVIHSLANKLVMRIKNICKQCQAPGFGKTSVQGKLQCQDCGIETELYQFKVLNCIQCDYVEVKPRDDGITQADPQHCPYCNP